MTKLFHVSLWVLMGWTLCSVWNPLTAAASNPININVIITESHLLSGHGRPAVEGSSIDYVAIVGAKISLDKIHSGPNGTTSWFRVKPGEDTTVVAIDDAANTTQANSTGRFTCSKKGKVTLQAMVTFAGVYKNPPPEFTIRVIDFSIKAAESGDLQNIVDGLTAVPAIPPLYLPAKKNPQGAYQQIKAYAPGITTDAETSVHWQIKESKADPVFDDWAGQANGIPVKLTPEPITAADPGNHTFILQAGIDDDQDGELSDGEVYRALKIKVVEVQFKLEGVFDDPSDPYPVRQGIGDTLRAYISPPDPDVLAKISFYVDDPSKIKSITPVIPIRNPEFIFLEASASKLGQTTLHAHAAISTGYNLDDNGIELIDPINLYIEKTTIAAGGINSPVHETYFSIDFLVDYTEGYTASIAISGGAGMDKSSIWWWATPATPAVFILDGIGEYSCDAAGTVINIPLDDPGATFLSGIVRSSNKVEKIYIDVSIVGTQAFEPTSEISFSDPNIQLLLGDSTTQAPYPKNVWIPMKITVDLDDAPVDGHIIRSFASSVTLQNNQVIQASNSGSPSVGALNQYVELDPQSIYGHTYHQDVTDGAGQVMTYFKIINSSVVNFTIVSADMSFVP